jgi:hypothetical protein
MTVLYHPEFVRDIQRFATKYAKISPTLGVRFRQDVDMALDAVKTNPTGTGPFHQYWIAHPARGAKAQSGRIPFFRSIRSGR